MWQLDETFITSIVRKDPHAFAQFYEMTVQTFYRYLSEQKPLHEAFSSTQKELSRRYSPYYWAAFQLIQ